MVYNMVDGLDSQILHFINQFAQRSWLLDKTIAFISKEPFIGGGVATSFFWWAWFCDKGTKEKVRGTILCGLAASLAALFTARTLAVLLPFRARPYLNADLHFRPPYGTAMRYADLIHWSSFPSDHAVLYFSVATCIFLVSRKMGILAFFHTLFVVCFPLVYLGVHYPSDILVGALLGIGFGSLSKIERLRDGLARVPLRFLNYSKASFYMCFYLCSFLFATEFDSLRKIAFYAFHELTGIRHGQY